MCCICAFCLLSVDSLNLYVLHTCVFVHELKVCTGGYMCWMYGIVLMHSVCAYGSSIHFCTTFQTRFRPHVWIAVYTNMYYNVPIYILHSYVITHIHLDLVYIWRCVWVSIVCLLSSLWADIFLVCASFLLILYSKTVRFSGAWICIAFSSYICWLWGAWVPASDKYLYRTIL